MSEAASRRPARLTDDRRGTAPAASVHTDICIIGSGPAGLTIAGELAGLSVHTIVVESGGIEESAGPEDSVGEAPDEIESVGYPRVMEQRLVRNRMFGGTSHSWTGRCAPFDDIDFRSRAWVPFSGWPLGREEIDPFADRACDYLGLEPILYGDRLLAEPGFPKPVPALDPALLRHCLWQYSADTRRNRDFMRFGPAFLAKDAPNVSIMLHATATHLTTDPSGSHVNSVELVGRGGRKVTIHPRMIVLCMGGIETPRLLLNSNRVVPHGVGNGRDMVGRFLMDHPRCTLATYAEGQAARIRHHYGMFRMGKPRRTNYFVQGLTLSPAYQERHQLLNCAAWLTEDRAPDDPWEAAKRLISGREGRKLQDGWAIASQPGLISQGVVERLRGRGLTHKLRTLKLDCIVEQCPDPQSRLTLAERRDRFGLRLARLNWRVSLQERKTVMALGHTICGEMQRLGLPVPDLAGWVRQRDLAAGAFVDVCHPTGTTRMATDPREGVVDEDCRVHGTDNLFIAGSSVFPTSGHANPTLMIVAMAIRLADRIKAELRVARTPRYEAAVTTQTVAVGR